MENESNQFAEPDQDAPKGNAPVYFSPKLPWPEGGHAQLVSAPRGGVAVFTEPLRGNGFAPAPEAFFSTAADLILYMLSKYGEETAREVHYALSSLYGDFAAVPDPVDQWQTEPVDPWPPEADDGAQAATKAEEAPLSHRIAEAVMLLRETGWVVTPDLEPKNGVTIGRAIKAADASRPSDGTIYAMTGKREA